MNERVRQHLAQSLVDRRVVIPRHVVRRNLERHLHPRRDRLVDAEEEVEDVSAPVGAARTHAIRPADVRREMFAVVEEEVRQNIRNLVEVTEADNPSKRGVHIAVASTSRRADLHQEAGIGQPAPLANALYDGQKWAGTPPLAHLNSTAAFSLFATSFLLSSLFISNPPGGLYHDSHYRGWSSSNFPSNRFPP